MIEPLPEATARLVDGTEALLEEVSDFWKELSPDSRERCRPIVTDIAEAAGAWNDSDVEAVVQAADKRLSSDTGLTRNEVRQWLTEHGDTPEVVTDLFVGRRLPE